MLDDGLKAGSAPAVRCFFSALIIGFRRISLEVDLDKTEIIPACTSQSFGPADLQGCCWHGLANIINFFVQLSALPSGAMISWVVAWPRQELF